MQPNQPLTAAWHAQAILSAWSANDTIRLEREVGLLEEQGIKSDPLEAEKMDLLAGIAAELTHKGASTGICGSLLRHLAATPFREPRWEHSRWAVQ